MGLYRAPKGTKVGVVGPDGESTVIEFKDSAVSVTDEALDRIMAGLAEDPNNVVRAVRSKGESDG